MKLKKFTEKNLRADKACLAGMQFVLPVIKAKEDVAMALYKSGHYPWLFWALGRGYDVSSLGPTRLSRVGKENNYGKRCACEACKGFDRHLAMFKKQEAQK